MKIGTLALMTGVAAAAMLSAADAKPRTTNSAGMDDASTQQMMLAQNDTNAQLEARISALEEELQNSEMRQASAVNTPPPAPSGWWNDTKISGRMYFDATNIDHKSNGSPVGNADNGTNFDIKRFYIGIDHTFNSMFSANVTTDTTYDATTGAGQIYLKKAFLQAKVDPLLTIRVGAADLPWVPYVEGLYGYRYLENTLIDRTKFGTSSDWGVHVLGTAFDGILNYDFAAINGGGYKKIPTGGGTNRFENFDYEGRVSAVYQGFNLGIGGYTGELGTAFGTTTHHTATRLDAVAAYIDNGLRLGVEYFKASNYSAALVQTTTAADGADGVSAFGSYTFVDWLPEWSVFGRYDTVDPTTTVTPAKNDEYYTFGVTWSPVKIVDLSLAYKHEAVRGGSFTGSNGAIGSTTGALRGTYNEIGIFGDFQF